jgi:5'-nucleotidase
MQILVTNDDGIYAPGLAALEREMRSLGDVCLVAPSTEQSGVGHSITYLTPLIVKEVFDGERHRGWAVEGSPADCVKLGVFEFCPRRPDLVVSGINYGLNAGINVLYSGTVAAAIEGAFFGITSFALSLQYEDHPHFDEAARIAGEVIRAILAAKGPEPQLFNINIPTAALFSRPRVKIVPMDVAPYNERFEKRIDPRGRSYYWATGTLPAPRAQHETDLTAIKQGCVTVTPLDFDLTKRCAIEAMQSWPLPHSGQERDSP